MLVGEPGRTAAADEPRGYIGSVFEEEFTGLYKAAAAEESAERGASGRSVVDFAREDALIADIADRLETETARVENARLKLHVAAERAHERDRAVAMFLSSQGLKEGVNFPHGPSSLDLEGDTSLRQLMTGRRTLDPRPIIADARRDLEIAQGRAAKHVNLLASTGPPVPSHLRSTVAAASRQGSPAKIKCLRGRNTASG